MPTTEGIQNGLLSSGTTNRLIQNNVMCWENDCIPAYRCPSTVEAVYR